MVEDDRIQQAISVQSEGPVRSNLDASKRCNVPVGRSFPCIL